MSHLRTRYAAYKEHHLRYPIGLAREEQELGGSQETARRRRARVCSCFHKRAVLGSLGVGVGIYGYAAKGDGSGARVDVSIAVLDHVARLQKMYEEWIADDTEDVKITKTQIKVNQSLGMVS